MLGSVLQGLALLLYLPFDGLMSLYIVSALFGLFQGGIVPMYALIVRDYFTPSEAGARVGTGDHGDADRHGVRRLGVGRHLRRHRLLPRRLRQRHRLEPAQRRRSSPS